jgi:hypothetical protein
MPLEANVAAVQRRKSFPQLCSPVVALTAPTEDQ